MSLEQQQTTKHDLILKHIAGLKVGEKISVRGIAKAMDVSEGTAYRAIKEAENMGLVSTRERIGTVRVEKQQRTNLEQLTFGDVSAIVDGHVLGGAGGLSKPLNKFVIGAMEVDAMQRYIDVGSLLIVGNRTSAHMLALQLGSGVLITGGFDANEEVKATANALDLPIISSSYDTFTVASLINRAIYDRLIKRKIMLVEDLVNVKSPVYSLKSTSTAADWRTLMEQTGSERFPVVDEWNRVVGIVTAKDVIDASPEQAIDRFMTRNPRTVNLRTSIASAAHMMVWEGIEMLPVTDDNRKLRGVINRRDVLKTMQSNQQQPQIGETFEDLIWTDFEQTKDEDGQLSFKGLITPQMTSQLGTVSEGVLSTLITKAAYTAIRTHKKADLVLDNVSTYFVKPLQIESEIVIVPRIIEVSRKFGKVDVEIRHNGGLVCKAMLTAQVIEG